jgi:hypothetical protein
MANVLGSFFAGRVMAGEVKDKSGEIAAEGRADIANIKADSAHNTSMALVVALNQSEDESDNWRQYAARLRVNLDARKMSEATLLAELKKANVEHPLATEEGFAEIFKKNLDEQYAADDEAFNKRIYDEQQKSVTIGRDAVG